MLPDWSPGLHPLVVHFPIALLVVAALADALGAAVRLTHGRAAGRTLHGAAVGLYALGALGAAAAYRTGDAASEAVAVPADALGLLNAHADAAWVLVWVAAGFALVRVGVLVLARRAGHAAEAPALHAALALVGVAGLGLLYQTAERGGELVYRYGVGVAAANAAEAPAADRPSADAVPDAAGAWTWTPDGRLPPSARMLVGSADAATRPASGAGVALGAPALFTLGPPAGDLAARVELDLSGFAGEVRLVHHAQGARDYDFVAVERAAATPDAAPTTVRLGRVRGGAETVYDAVTSAHLGRMAVSLSAVGTHFRAGVGDARQAHGHDDAAPAGAVGLAVDGTGSALLLGLAVTPVPPDA